MKEELHHQFEAIFAKVIETEGKNVQFIPKPNPVYISKADGFRLEYAFSHAIKYTIKDEEYFLAFRYIQSKDLVDLNTCKAWVYAVRYLPLTVRVCLVTDKGFMPEALEYVRNNSFDIDNRLILAKYCGDDEQSLVLNRLWTDYSDSRGRTGVLTNEKPCAGIVLSMAFDAYNPIGILSELGIPIKREYEFKCPYLSNEDIEEQTIKILNSILLKEEEMFEEPDYLWRIAEAEGIQIELIDMAEEFFGEYSYAEKKIYLNQRERLYGPTVRERFTLAHELGHHFLHHHILEQYNYTAVEDQESLNMAGASNEQVRYFECQANKFASYLLMPGKVFDKYANEVMLSMDIRKGFVYDDNQYSPGVGAFNHINALEFVRQVAKHFYVSEQAARYRLKDLQLLREQYDISTPNLFV